MNNQTLPIPNPNDWVGVPAAAKILGVDVRHVRRMVASGILTGHKIPGIKSVMLWRAEVHEVAAARARIRPLQPCA